jgi:hypothetical protein
MNRVIKRLALALGIPVLAAAFSGNAWAQG